MSSRCTIPRFVRCRVRDLASCFYACQFPLEQEPDTFNSTKPPHTSNGSMVFESKGAREGHNANGKMHVVKKTRKDGGGESVQSSSQNNSEVRERNKAEDVSQAEPRFAEEDYIVFCFREDGAIHMINEGKSYDENDDGKGSEEMDSECPSKDEIIEINTHVEQPNASKMDSFESCDSNLSDTSESSFAFPILSIEWIGSPVHMPESQKPETPSVRLHCCRF